jgi:eukaryotic-like serine/threonine-protein kinase
LGRGGMGVVYLAHNKWMGRDEVLKVMGRHVMERPGVLERFQREIRAVAKLRHPNIVTAYHATRIGESLVFAMEYVEGLDLSKMVKAKGPLPVSHACNFIFQSALGLQHAHEEGLVHRDIKPGNLMLARKGDKATVKLLDFGLARATREQKVDTALTSEGQALGTPDFIAPEQILHATSADIRADIYSLGGTLFYLLSGRPPFEGNSAYDVYQGHISRDAGPLNLIRPEVPTELAALVAKMLAKDPGRRFQTPGELAESLTPFFKKRNAAFREPRAVASPTSQPTVGGATDKSVSVPTRPVSDAGGLAVPTQKEATEPDVAKVRWESLIEFRDTEPLKQAAPPVAKPRRWRPKWLSLARLAASVFALILMGVIFYVTTDYGRIKIVIDDPNAVVQIDGGRILIESLGESIALRAGEHDLTIKWRDGQFETGKFVIRRGGSEQLRVEYNATVSDRQGTYRRTSPSTKTASGPPAESPAAAPTDTPPAAMPEQTAGDKTAPLKSLTNSIGMKLLLIPAGEFMMGSTPEQIERVAGLFPEFKKEWGVSEQPQHRVRISRPFYLDAHEVTRGQFGEFVRATNYRTEPERDGKGGSGIDLATNACELGPNYNWRNTGFPQSNRHPVVNVTWNDATAFCDWLSRKEGQSYHLPTEAQWEYACRAGTTTLFSTGDDPSALVAVANLGGNPDGFRFTAPVGSLQANGFGLFDMHGNVWEWCADWFAQEYYAGSPVVDPTGPLSGSHRVSRGQTWDGGGADVRSAHRDLGEPVGRGASTGFRVARSIPEEDGSRGDTVALPNHGKSESSADQAPRDSVPGDMDRRAAEAVLPLGGSVTVRVNGQERPIEPGKGLPTDPFQLTRVRLGDQPELTDAQLEPFRGLVNLIDFRLSKAPRVTDVGVAHLRDLPRLEGLWLVPKQACFMVF